MKNFLAYTLRRLGTDHVDIYRPGRVDPDRADRGDRRRDRRAGQGGLRPSRRPVRGRRRDRPARARRPPDRRPADRVLADLARDRGGDPARPAASSASASPPTACCRADCSSGHWSRERARRWRRTTSARSAPRFTGENLERNLALVEALRALADAKGATRRPARDRVGALPRRRHRAARRRAQARPARRGARRARPRPHADDLAAIERGGPGRRRRRRALPRARRWRSSTASAARPDRELAENPQRDLGTPPM